MFNFEAELSKYVTVVKKGSRYFISCPFHKEDTPSCLVDFKTNRFYCFGCNESGDAYKLLKKISGIDYGKPKRVVPDTIKINNLVSQLYERNLTSTYSGSDIKKKYLKRGLTDDVIRTFRIGLTPKKNLVYELLKECYKDEGFSKYEIEKTTLLNSNKTDFFRDRLTFPILDEDENVLGFTGRTVIGDDIKYLSSKENKYFKKGSILYNFYNARETIKKANRVYIVEGTFDLIAFYKLGFKNVISTLTCQLKQAQIDLIKGSFNEELEIVLAYDNDKAGLSGSIKAFELLKKNGFYNVSFLRFGEKDAGKYYEEEKYDELRSIIKKRLSLGEFFKPFFEEGSNKLKVLDKFKSLLFTLPDKIIEECINDFTKDKSVRNNLKELLLKEEDTASLLKKIFYLIKEDDSLLEVFNLMVNPKLLKDIELESLKNLKKYNLKAYENSNNFRSLVLTFITKRTNELIEG